MRYLAAALLSILALALLGLAAWQATLDSPWLFSLGLALSAAPPLGFVILTRARQAGRHHPVMVSVLSGMGCVMTMVGVQRFGDQHQWIAGLALLMLASWVAYQRWAWRQPRPPDA